MPWDEVSVDDAKVRFIEELRSGRYRMSELCSRHGISRQTGYKYRDRYAAEGVAGLAERSRAPREHGRATDAELVERLLALRRQHPTWGPKKLLAVLRRADPEQAWPAPSTGSEILRRAGLSEPRRRVRRPEPQERPFGAVSGPNDTWCVDFKGWFRTGDGRRCDPLTVTDAASRFLLGLELVTPTGEGVWPVMMGLFREYGLPRAIRSDNGPPFASTGAGGLTRLSVCWAKLGIDLERTQPGCPYQNGRHERMHGTLKAECCRPAAATPAAQQARFDAFRDEYNEQRPHEALGQVPPGSLYQPSPRRLPDRVPEPEYGADDLVRRVRSNGEVKWRNSLLFLSEALAGEPVGIREQADGLWLVRFAAVPVAIIDHRTNKITRLGPGRPPRPKATTTTNQHLSAMYPDHSVSDVSG